MTTAVTMAAPAVRINPLLSSLARPLDSLTVDGKNARKHDSRSIDGIAASLSEFGQQKPIVALVDGKVIAGNGTLEAARRLGWTELAVVVFSDEAKAKKFALADNRTAELSEWDFANLTEALAEIPQIELDRIGFTEVDLQQLLNPEPEAPKRYSTAVVSPIYTPKHDKPEIGSLVDRTKTSNLLDRISRAEIPADVRDFLKVAAERHSVFDYRNIADFYAHSPPDIQRLFEDSALIIVDFNQAVENGYAKLTKAIDGLISQQRATEALSSGNDEDADEVEGGA